MVIAALAFVAFTYAFQQTAIVPVISTIQHDFHTTVAWSAWLLSGYLMVATVLTPVFGRLGDLHGAARMMLVSLTVFLAGSVAAALVPDLAGLIVSRAAQGAGGAVLPLAFAVTRWHLPDRAVGRAIAVLTATFGFGGTVGFATGGVLTQAVSWRLVFAAGAVAVAAGIVVLARVVPLDPGTAEGGFDVGGAMWLGAASLAVLLALTLGIQLGWLSPAPILLLVASGVAALVWVRTELRHTEPLIDLRVLRDRTVTFVNTATIGLGWARFAGLLLVPMLVIGPGGSRYGFGADAAAAGWFLIPDGIGTVLGGLASGALSSRLRPGRVFAAGLLVTAVGAALLAGGHSQVVAVLVGAFLLGFGTGIAVQASSAVTTRDVPPEAAAASSSLNSTLRRLSGGIGDQVSTVILAAVAASGMVSAGGFTIAFAVAAALALVGVAFSLAVPSRPG